MFSGFKKHFSEVIEELQILQSKWQNSDVLEIYRIMQIVENVSYDCQWLKAWPALNVIPHWLFHEASGPMQTPALTQMQQSHTRIRVKCPIKCFET